MIITPIIPNTFTNIRPSVSVDRRPSGLLRLGFLVRFISNSVMTGFLSGLGVLTILGQVGDITGYYSESHHRVVILRLRDRDEGGSTFIRALQRFAKELQQGENLLLLTGVDSHVRDQLEKTDLLDLIGEDNIFPA